MRPGPSGRYETEPFFGQNVRRRESFRPTLWFAFSLSRRSPRSIAGDESPSLKRRRGANLKLNGCTPRGLLTAAASAALAVGSRKRRVRGGEFIGPRRKKLAFLERRKGKAAVTVGKRQRKTDKENLEGEEFNRMTVVFFVKSKGNFSDVFFLTPARSFLLPPPGSPLASPVALDLLSSIPSSSGGIIVGHVGSAISSTPNSPFICHTPHSERKRGRYDDPTWSEPTTPIRKLKKGRIEP